MRHRIAASHDRAGGKHKSSSVVADDGTLLETVPSGHDFAVAAEP